MNREEKQLVVEELQGQMQEFGNFYIADTSSLSVEQVNNIRRKCFENDIVMKVAKNTLIRKAIEQGGLEDFSAIIQTVKDTGALDYVRDVARNEAELACQAIAHLPNNQYREAMVALAEFSVSRSF